MTKARRRKGLYERFIKRPQDMILSAVAFVVLSPVLALTALLVRIKLGSPVLFAQDRPGRNAKVFKLYKFRTMTDGRDQKGNLLPDEDRLTPFGKKLRSTSLDELPELINIIKGDMSLVGPRPLLVQYLPLYNERQRHRHDVRPGLTGWAQVNGRNTLTWQDKFEYDVEYTEKYCFSMDLRIILMTFRGVIKREGINPENSATMDFFRGNHPVCEQTGSERSKDRPEAHDL